jgi:cyclase
VTGEGVVMIDTPQLPVDAVKWRDEIAKYGPVRYLINTEPHWDHFSGNYFFQGTIVAHEGTRKAIMATSVDQWKPYIKQISAESLQLLGDFSFRAPEITFSEKLTLHLGNHTFQLISLPGHTPYEVAVYIPEEKVVFSSDNVFAGVQTWMQQAVPYQWLDSLKRLQELDFDILVPGHGRICDKGYLDEMSAFIQDWINAVKQALDAGISIEEAQAKISFLDRYPMESGTEFLASQVQKWNVARLYEVLQKGENSQHE